MQVPLMFLQLSVLLEAGRFCMLGIEDFGIAIVQRSMELGCIFLQGCEL